jgi:hypothetical protein
MTQEPKDQQYIEELASDNINIIDDEDIIIDVEALVADVEEKTKKELLALPQVVNKPKTLDGRKPINIPKTMVEKHNCPSVKWKNFLHPSIREKFLKYVAETGSLMGALIRLKKYDNFEISKSSVNRLLSNYSTFKTMYDEALDEYSFKLEEEATRRAVDGVNKDIFFQGEYVTTQKEYSDTLLVKLLEANNQKFKKASAGGNTNIKTNAPVQININKHFDGM